MLFHYVAILFSLEKGVALYLKKLEFPSLKAALFGWCGQMVLEQKIF